MSAFLTVEQARERYPHGSRARARLGRCDCFPCRVANTRYEAERQAERREAAASGDVAPRTLVPAESARRHLLWLSQQGIGSRSVAPIAKVSYSVLVKIRDGKIRRTRHSTSERILAVTPRDVEGAQNLPAGPTWELLACLLAGGWTKTKIGRALGSTAKLPSLQLSRDRVLARHARAVERLHEQAILIDPRVRERCRHVAAEQAEWRASMTRATGRSANPWRDKRKEIAR